MEKYIIIFFICYGLWLFFEEKIKGCIGEKIVATRLCTLPKQKYKVLNDILLETENGTTQIDHVVISVYGIFVIETKNYKGWITGSEYGDFWTQNMYGNKYRFRNPLKQNYAHVKALEQKLEIPEDKFIPIVVFSSRSTIKVNTKSPVIYMGQIRRKIKRYNDEMFFENELDVLVDKLLSFNITSKEARKEHVKQIKTKLTEKRNMISENRCPKCGGMLVEKNGKYGRFIGCNNFPKCRYIKK